MWLNGHLRDKWMNAKPVNGPQKLIMVHQLYTHTHANTHTEQMESRWASFTVDVARSMANANIDSRTVNVCPANDKRTKQTNQENKTEIK